MEKIKAAAVKLVGLYISQGVATCIYISLVSSVGEQMAARLRCELMKSLLLQDVAFFDKHKTGELMNRLSTDVQDFKHAFKQVVSQGLKSATQLVGGFISLYVVSPKLTALLLCLLPPMYGLGFVYGKFLRSISSSARTAEASSVSVANEAVGNVRTVKAFSMENLEQERYEESVSTAARLYQRLGLHIGVFQGTNTFFFFFFSFPFLFCFILPSTLFTWSSVSSFSSFFSHGNCSLPLSSSSLLPTS